MMNEDHCGMFLVSLCWSPFAVSRLDVFVTLLWLVVMICMRLHRLPVVPLQDLTQVAYNSRDHSEARVGKLPSTLSLIRGSIAPVV